MAIKVTPRALGDVAPGKQALGTAEWASRYALETGVLDDYDGTGLRLEADGSGLSLTLKAGRALILGYEVEVDADETIDLSGGATVGASQERRDRVALRLNLSDYSATVERIYGSPSPAGQAIALPYTYDVNAWDLPLGGALRQGVQAIPPGNVFLERSWVPEVLYLPAGGDPRPHPIGTIRFRDDGYDRLVLPNGTGTPVWRYVRDTPLSNIVGVLESPGYTGTARRIPRTDTFVVQPVTLGAETYRRHLRVDWAAFATGFSASNVECEVGIRLYRNGVLVSDRTKPGRLIPGSVQQSRSTGFVLDADVPYTVQLVGSCTDGNPSGTVWCDLTPDVRFTYATITTRGMA